MRHPLPLFASLAMIAGFAATARAAESVWRPQGPPAIVVYNDDIGLVRVPGTIILQKGRGTAVYDDVPLRVDSTSIRLEGDGIRVLRQSFHHDLWTGERVFRRFLGDSISYRYGGKRYDGVLSGVDGDDLFIRRRDSTDVLTMLKRSQITEVEFPSALNLATRPFVRWQVEAVGGGEHRAAIAYLTRGLSWTVDYVAMLDAGERSLEWTGWATITNHTGSSFDRARVSLVAGELNRGRGAIDRGAVTEGEAGERTPPEAEDLFAYHTYAVKEPVDLPEAGTVQVALMGPARIAAKRVHRYDGARDGSKVRVALEFPNERRVGIGQPLPAGRVRVYAPDPSGAASLVGEDGIEHTASGERVRIVSGVAFDLVGERTRSKHTRISRNVTEDEIRIRLRNRAGRTERVTVVENLYGSWEITAETAKHEKKSVDTIEFEIEVPPGETTVTYTVRYSF